MKELGIKNLRVYHKPNKIMKLLRTVLAGLIITATLTACSKFEILNSPHGFENAVITNNGNSVVIPIKNWRDYKGQAIQIVTEDGMAILSSSYCVSLMKGDAAEEFAFNYAMSMTDLNGTMSFYLDPNEHLEKNNYLVYDNVRNFDKAIIIQNNRAVILPVIKWWDFSGEQVQILTPCGLVVLASNYHTLLVADKQSRIKAVDFANMLVGRDGQVVDFAENYIYEENNWAIWDNKNLFIRAILLNDDANTIVPLRTWNDYDGEQLQLKIVGGPVMVASAFNAILVDDSKSIITAEDISDALIDNTINYAEGYIWQGGRQNKQFWDSDNCFQNAQIIAGDDGVILPIQNWRDGNGEQLQFRLPNGVTLRSASIDTRMFSPTQEDINVISLTEDLTDTHFNLDPNYQIKKNNRLFYKHQIFPYALTVTENSIILYSLDSWRDYRGGEALRLTLTDGKTVVLTTAYDTKLIDVGASGIDILEVVEWFNDNDKTFYDLRDGTPPIGAYKKNGKESGYISTYNYAIALNRDVATIMQIDRVYKYPGSTDEDGDYTDYSEQIQIRLIGQRAIYSDLTNMVLISSNDEDLVEKIARAHISDEAIVNRIASGNDFVPKFVPKK